MNKDAGGIQMQRIGEGKVGVVYVLNKNAIKGRRTKFCNIVGVKRGKSILDHQPILEGLRMFIWHGGLIRIPLSVFDERFELVYAEYESDDDVNSRCALLKLQEIPIFAVLKFDNKCLCELFQIEQCWELLRKCEEQILSAGRKRFVLRLKLYGDVRPPLRKREEDSEYYYARLMLSNECKALKQKSINFCAQLVVPEIGQAG